MMQLSASLDDWKLAYRMLHSKLRDSEELLDSDLMETLQSALQAQARDAGVDVDDHAQWAAWLRGPSDADKTPSLTLVE